jgi:hypothetical protein
MMLTNFRTFAAGELVKISLYKMCQNLQKLFDKKAPQMADFIKAF